MQKASYIMTIRGYSYRIIQEFILSQYYVIAAPRETQQNCSKNPRFQSNVIKHRYEMTKIKNYRKPHIQ